MLRSFSVTLVLLFCGAIAIGDQVQRDRPAMTNADVLKMLNGGLSVATVVLAIKHGPTNFDTSVNALVTLKQQGVSAEVLNAMLNARSQVKRVGPASAENADLTPDAVSGSLRRATRDALDKIDQTIEDDSPKPVGPKAESLKAKLGSRRTPVKVFVSVRRRDGFVDGFGGERDSVKDLQNALKLTGDKLRLASSKESADIILAVLERGQDADAKTANQPALPGGIVLPSTPVHRIWLRAVVEIGDYHREIVSSDTTDPIWGSGWGILAHKMVKDLVNWTDANYEQIITTRRGKH